MVFIKCINYIKLIVVILLLIPFAVQQCSFPSTFQNSIWLDSDKGTLTFTGSTMAGWEFTDTSGTTMDGWECYLISNISSTEFVLALKSASTISAFSVNYTPFLCLNLTAVTAYSYYYYLVSDEQTRLNYERIAVVETNNITSSYPGLNDICTPLTSGPTTNEYHMLVKNDNVASAVMNCPADFYGQYHYNLTNSVGTFCNTGTEVWDVCTDRQQMTFNYSQCTTEVAYSASGIVDCIFNMSTGNDLLQTVINTDVILGSNNHRFTCFMSSLNQDGSLVVSQALGSCTKDQTPDTIPVTPAGVEKGFRLVLTPHTNGLCPITTTSSTTTSTTTTASTTTSTTTSSTTSTTSSTTTTTTPPPTTTTTTTAAPTTTTILAPVTTTTSSPAVSTSSATNNTLAYVAFGILGGVVLILVIVVVVCVVKRKCCKKKKPPRTPDIIIEALPHTLYGKRGLPSSIEDAPRATTFIKEENPQTKDVVAFPRAKTNEFLVTLRRASNAPTFHSLTESIKTHAVVTYNEIPELDNGVPVSKMSANLDHSNIKKEYGPDTKKEDVVSQTLSSKANSQEQRHSAKPYNGICSKNSAGSKHSTFFKYESPHRKDEVSVMDSIIMDENVNFALTYHPRMIEAKREWDKANPLSVHLPKTSFPPSLSPNTVTSLNQTLCRPTSKTKSNHSAHTSHSSKDVDDTKKTTDAETQTGSNAEGISNSISNFLADSNRVFTKEREAFSKSENDGIVSNDTIDRPLSPLPVYDAKNAIKDEETIHELVDKHKSNTEKEKLERVNQKGVKRHFSDTSGYTSKQTRKLVAFRQKTASESVQTPTKPSVRGIQVTPVNELSDMSLPVSPVGSGLDLFGEFLNKGKKMAHRTSTPVKRIRSFSVTPTFGMKGDLLLEDGLSEIQ